RNFTGIFADEVGNYTATAYALLQRLRTNIRVPAGHRALEWYTSNPFGRSHQPLYKGYILKAPYWRPFRDEHGRYVVNTHSTYLDNPHIDHEQYRRQLQAGCPDPALLEAWVTGTWGPIGGSLFQFDASRHVLAATPWTTRYFRLGGDHGSA